MRTIARVARCFVVLAVLFTASVAPTQAQPTHRLTDFLTQLIASACSLDPSFALTPGETLHAPRGQASVTVVSDEATTDPSDSPDIRALTIIVTHGASSSTHVIFYEDNDDSASLTCGDTIVGVS